MAKKMVMVYVNTKMEAHIMDNGKITKNRDREQ